MQVNNNIRKSYIDNLKGIGILLVVLGHISSPFGSLIYSFHMPLFFVISGLFLNFKIENKEFINSGLKRLLSVYFLFAIVGVFADIIKRWALHRPSLDYLEELKGVFIFMDYSHLENTYAHVLWFLPALFFARLFVFLIGKYISNIFIQISLVCILFIGSFYVQLPFALDEAMNAVLFVFIGSYFFSIYKKLGIYTFLMCLFITILVLITYGLPKLNMAVKRYDDILINILWAVSITFLMVIILKNMTFQNTWLAIWGKETMFIYVLHAYTNNISSIITMESDFYVWYVRFFMSVLLLQCILTVKIKFNNNAIFRYI